MNIIKRVNKSWGVILLLPVFLMLIFFILLPELWGIYLSFTNMRIGESISFVGLSNYLYTLTDSIFIKAFVTNMIFVIGVVVLQMIFGLFLALFLNQKFRFHKIWVALILTPICITPSVMGTIWKYILNFHIGPVNYIIQQIGFPRAMWLSGESLALMSVILICVWKSIPYVFIMVYPARLTIPEDLYEAAKIDGGNIVQLFWHITFPLLKPVLLITLVFRAIFALRTFGVIWNLTEGGPIRTTETMSIYLYKQGFKYWRFGTAAAVGTIILIITILISSYLIKNMYQTSFKVNH